ncbi:MAG: 1-acyl-sn-glycerol-3-phosphate acyltransferase [Myxococcota bacterium]|nr:1-acyl-sn-glycerol-3-phosphate acyltransferase [Myxococcota bacterium]
MTPRFSPIAIVGQACVLPGALTPAELWRLALEGRSALSPVPEGRWGIDRALMLAKPGEDRRDRASSDRGGYVQGFERVFDPAGFAVPADALAGLDPLFLWLLHTGREALREARFSGDLARAGAIVGNLSYPSSSLSAFAERTWLSKDSVGSEALLRLGLPTVDPRNRFMSGLPAHLLAQALGLGAGAFALDAACASSLYAIKLACDALQEGRADLMLAGAVNRADLLFLHAGFTALGALSPSGQSRPFHADADGLVPGEGAALVALRRLEDAARDGSRILGIIRGIGLSNDGRGRGMLVPSTEGQVRALEAAYRSSGLEPRSISYLECHATGTQVGDAVEVQTLSRVFAGEVPIPIGSLKANLGHLITTAGAGGLIKVLGALRDGVLPPSPHLDRVTPALEGAPLRLLEAAEPWTASRQGPRRAGVSAFGFGGNNAHLIVEEAGQRRSPSFAPNAVGPARPPVALVALGARVASQENAAQFAAALFTGSSTLTQQGARAREVTLSLEGLRFPPTDLAETLPQQLMVLAAAREALGQLAPLPHQRTGVYVGMQCDAEIARHGARWRAAGWAGKLEADPSWLSRAREGLVRLLGAAGVVGAMPNIPANRLCSQFDLQAVGFTVSAEELSGVRALQLARWALERGEIDAALVGAVDLSAEEVHGAAAQAILGAERRVGGDAAVVLIAKRLEDALRAGDPVLAVLRDAPAQPGEALVLGDGEGALGLEPLFGHPHAASGLLHVAAAALCCAHRALPGERGLKPWFTRGPRRAQVKVSALGDQAASVWLEEAPAKARRPGPVLVDEAGGEDSGGFLSQLAAQASPRPTPPLLTFPAHSAPARLAPVELPKEPLPSEGAARPGSPPIQVMEPAPYLPPVDHAARLTLEKAGPAVLAPARLAEPARSVLEGHQAYRSQIARTHQEFLAAQAGLHQQFLLGREQAMAVLLGGSAPSLPSTSTPFPSASRGEAVTGAARPAPPLSANKAGAVAGAGPAPSLRASTDGAVTGRSFSRAELEVHASGKISDLFGPAFASQDEHAIQVRMPEPPLLLADRVVGLKAEPGSMGLGTVWTETDVREDSWYLNRGFMPAGVMIEAGQADLFLISYLGVDGFNRGARAYRLLGCELTYHGSLPRPGDTLRYDIHIDGHARQADTRLFFFHYDCMIGGRPALTVRNGQAGFFSREELDDSAGVLWKPEDQTIAPNARLDPPAVACQRTAFSAQQVRAFSGGDLFACFGPGFERGQTHVRTPSIQPGKMQLFESVEQFDPRGGPWGRGYLKVQLPIHSDDWFFQGHFKNDPCMPGTLMFEGCLQAMAFYLAGLGHTLQRDGWRFEPVPEETYRLQCRGQVLPTSRELTCELFVEEVHDGPYPTIYADLLGTVDGHKAFHARRVGLRLVPDWPLSSRAQLPRYEAPAANSALAVAEVNGFRFDFESLLACAWGKPSAAFGPMYEVFDGTRRVARLPGPPYHFMSRVSQVEGELGRCEPGASVEIAYDVPADAWYFRENGHPTMPFAVLLEAVLQPCGWLASYVGSALLGTEDLAFRNLDGSGQVQAEVPPGTGTLRTRVTLKSVSRSAGMILEFFEVQCFAGDTPVYKLETGFGFFPQAALENQVGLSCRPADRALLESPSTFEVDLRTRPERYCAGSLRLADPMLLMIDRVTAFEPQGGKAGLGFLRAEKDVDPGEWFFKAHFFQDPVQPGSLGLEAMIQLLQFFMIQQGLGEGMGSPRFESIALEVPMTWKYRGQVIPTNRRIVTTLEILEVRRDERGPVAVGEASLWVEGKRIYQATGLGMRIVDDGPAPRLPVRSRPRCALTPETRDYWRGLFDVTAGPVEDVNGGLLDRVLRSIHLSDPRVLERAREGGVLFLANHQTAVESTAFALVASALTRKPVLILAKVENNAHWLHLLMKHTFAYPGLFDPQMTRGFDRSDPAALPEIISGLARQMVDTGRSVMIHVEGTRAHSCRETVQRLSGTLIDMALETGRPIVPVRFVGGLPIQSLGERLEFPVGMGRQDLYLGELLTAESLRPLAYGERRERVLSAINGLGPPASVESPLDPDPLFEESVRRWMAETGASLGHAAIFRILEAQEAPSVPIRELVRAARTGTLRVPDTAEGRWLAELARRLYGERGPKVSIGRG